jgi:hypothetical protein
LRSSIANKSLNPSLNASICCETPDPVTASIIASTYCSTFWIVTGISAPSGYKVEKIYNKNKLR